MARLNALSIKMTDGTTAEKLAEEYGKVIENLQHITLASRLKYWFIRRSYKWNSRGKKIRKYYRTKLWNCKRTWLCR